MLADSTRVEILQTLAHRAGGPGGEPLGFAKLRRAVGVEDSGRFNYHLDKLEGVFVRKEDAGYLPTWPGLRVATLVSSGTLNASATSLSGEVPSICPDCDEPSRLQYEDGVVSITCPTTDHDIQYSWPFPPSAVAGRSADAVFDAVALDIQQEMEQSRTGSCPFCRSGVEWTVPFDGSELDLGLDEHTLVEVSCPTCWFEEVFPIEFALIGHPAVLAFVRRAGGDARRLPFVHGTTLTASVAVTANDPTRLTVQLAYDDKTLAVTVDDTLTVCGPAVIDPDGEAIEITTGEHRT